MNPKQLRKTQHICDLILMNNNGRLDNILIHTLRENATDRQIIQASWCSPRLLLVTAKGMKQ